MRVLCSRAACRRRGLSILEVIIATAIFVASVAVIAQLFDLGLAAARSSKLATIALLRCESKIDELVAGIEPLISSPAAVPYADDPLWQWTVAAEPTEVPGLLRVTVRVEHLDTQEQIDFAYELTRLITDPAYRASVYQPGPGGVGQPTAITIPEMLGLTPK